MECVCEGYYAPLYAKINEYTLKHWKSLDSRCMKSRGSGYIIDQGSVTNSVSHATWIGPSDASILENTECQFEQINTPLIRFCFSKSSPAGEVVLVITTSPPVNTMKRLAFFVCFSTGVCLCACVCVYARVCVCLLQIIARNFIFWVSAYVFWLVGSIKL